MSVVTLARDAALPQRDELLDARTVARCLELLLGADGPVAIDDCERLWARYDPGRSVRALYRVARRGASHMVAARTFADDARADRATRAATARAIDVGRLQPCVADRLLRAVYWTFPNDPAIAALDVLARPSATLDRLAGRAVVPALVAYVPERAATARCLDADGRTVAFAKAFGRCAAAHRAHQVADHFGRLGATRRSELCVPQVLGFSAALRLVISEAVPGTRASYDRAGDGPEAMWRLGIALARFHALRPPSGVRRRLVTTRELRRAAELVGCAIPQLAARAGGVAADLVARRPAPGELVCAHRDLNALNVVVFDGDRATLLDLDDVALGEAAVDLARVLAALHARLRRGKLGEQRRAALAAALLDGYREVRPAPPADALRWHTAAQLLINRTRAAVLWVNPKWAPHLSGVLDDVRAVLA